MVWKTAILTLFLSSQMLPSASAMGPCDGHDRLIDQRTLSQIKADQAANRLRCVVFVMIAEDRHGNHGWVKWHHARADRPTPTHSLGLFPAGLEGALAFGRIPDGLTPESTAVRVSVLLPTHRWWLVNTSRHGWQLRSGTVSEPDLAVLPKLFTDVAINAGVAEQPQSFERLWPGSSR